ncbi:MAG TPA: hypothetical protein VFP68_23200, partial [Burkholderiaceae bacterium]|nr:hypothetical protein [Burkholderiaceae bacterium]
VIDEAQNLTLFSLQRLQALADVHQRGRPVLHIVLVGEFPPSPLEDARHEGVPVEARRTVKLGPLDRQLTREYVLHRLAKAGWTGPPLFPVSATDAVFECSGGIPRRINRLCDRVLLRLFMEQGHEVSVGLVRMVHDMLQAELSGSGSGSTPDGDAGAGFGRAASRAAGTSGTFREVDRRGPAKVAGMSQRQGSLGATMLGDTLTIVHPHTMESSLSSSSRSVPSRSGPAASAGPSGSQPLFRPSVPPLGISPLMPQVGSSSVLPMGLLRATAPEPPTLTDAPSVEGETALPAGEARPRTAIWLILAASLAVATGGTAAWKILQRHSQEAPGASVPTAVPETAATATVPAPGPKSAVEGTEGTGSKDALATPAEAPATATEVHAVPSLPTSTESGKGSPAENPISGTGGVPSTANVGAAPPSAQTPIEAAVADHGATGAATTNPGALPPTSAGALAPAWRGTSPRAEHATAEGRREARHGLRSRANSAVTGQVQPQLRQSREAREQGSSETAAQSSSACTPAAEVMGLCNSPVSQYPARSRDTPGSAQQACDPGRRALGLCADQ